MTQEALNPNLFSKAYKLELCPKKNTTVRYSTLTLFLLECM